MVKKYKLSLTFNIMIIAFTLIATIFMITGFRFMSGEKLLVAGRLESFKFFTVDSNILMGISSLVFAIYDYLAIKGKINEIPRAIYIFKLVGTVSVALTFATVVFYLAPFTGYSYFAFFTNSNLFFHLIIPLLSFVSFLFFEKTNKIRFKDVIISLVPMLIYSIFYMINAFKHIENGLVPSEYDWYGFVKGGVPLSIFVFTVMLAGTYFMAVLLWYLNKKIK